MTQHDQLHRYLFENYAVRGELVTVSETPGTDSGESHLSPTGQNGAGGAVGRHQSADRDAEVCRRHYRTAAGMAPLQLAVINGNNQQQLRGVARACRARLRTMRI